MTLPNDISRCGGSPRTADTPQIWAIRTDCLECQRRTDPGEGEHISNMSPPEFIDGICPMRIAPDGGERGA